MTDANSELVQRLNIILQNALAGINQYFLHARMLKHWGFMKLADHEYKESIEEMRQADQLVERILSLGGVPNMQAIGNLSIGRDVEAVLRADLVLEERAHQGLDAALQLSAGQGDNATARLLEVIRRNEEEHMAFLRTQLELLDDVGTDAYLQMQT
ncbi:MAG: bacterioferritin [Alphaproteobacteria bacterium]|nr:bacterioferritin [Alphaproteobacteria bacterium]